MKKLKDFYGLIGKEEYVIDGVCYKVHQGLHPLTSVRLKTP